MPLLRQLARAYLLDRMLRGQRRQPRGWYAPRSRRRGRGGFYGPFPYYSTRTRRGTRVSVGGCCLPIPLGLLAAMGPGAELRRRTR